jgi:hypothetical protein
MSEQAITSAANTPNLLTDEPAAVFNLASFQAQSGIALRDTAILSVASGICVLNAKATVVGKYDFVGLYQNASIDPGSYLTRQWVSSGLPYNTGIAAQPGMVAMYVSYNYGTGEYVRVAVTSALTTSIIESNGSVSGSTTC